MTTGSERQRRADIVMALVMIAVSAAVWWEASKLPPAPFDPLGPKSFPMWIAMALGGLSVVAVIMALFGRALGRAETSLILGIGEEAPEDYALRPGLAVLAAVITMAYAAALSFTGISFLWATMAYIGALGWAMSDRTRRHTIIALAVAVISGAAITLIFTKIFVLDLP
ncbi:MAG: tripartite tricarboxylate transporter TctB family protein [Alphaproteobacteria bacterium]|nr:tripartite tricarboxylate transporter TctB family protein [Alphaproteobacteria bacterium]